MRIAAFITGLALFCIVLRDVFNVYKLTGTVLLDRPPDQIGQATRGRARSVRASGASHRFCFMGDRGNFRLRNSVMAVGMRWTCRPRQ